MLLALHRCQCLSEKWVADRGVDMIRAGAGHSNDADGMRAVDTALSEAMSHLGGDSMCLLWVVWHRATRGHRNLREPFSGVANGLVKMALRAFF